MTDWLTGWMIDTQRTVYGKSLIKAERKLSNDRGRVEGGLLLLLFLFGFCLDLVGLLLLLLGFVFCCLFFFFLFFGERGGVLLLLRFFVCLLACLLDWLFVLCVFFCVCFCWFVYYLFFGGVFVCLFLFVDIFCLFVYMNTCRVPHLEMKPKQFPVAVYLFCASQQTYCVLVVCDYDESHCTLGVSATAAAALFSCYMAGAMWNRCRLGASPGYTLQQCNSLQCHSIRSHIRRMHMGLAVTCQLHFWENDRDLLCVTMYHGDWTDTEIRVITESWPWRRKFSRRFCRDSNPRPFDHESIALPQSYPRFQNPIHCLHGYFSLCSKRMEKTRTCKGRH